MTRLNDIRTVECEAVGVGFFEDVRPLRGGAGELDWLLCGALSRLIEDNRLTGAPGDLALLTSNGKIPAAKVFLIGLGKRESLSSAALKDTVQSAAERIAASGTRQLLLDCSLQANGVGDDLLAAVREGMSGGASGRGIEIRLLPSQAFSPGKTVRQTTT